MKTAFEWDRELYVNAVPKVVDEDEQTWRSAFQVEKAEALSTRLLWGSNVPGSFAPERVLVGGIQAMVTMGYDMTEAEKLIPEAIKAREEHDSITLGMLTARVFHLVNTAKKIPDHPYWKYHYYNTFEEYASAVTFPEAKPVDTESKDFFDRTHAGWLTQIIGAALGTCIEGYTSTALKNHFGEITDYPRKPNTYNDDITFELAVLEAFRKKGYEMEPADIAEHWVGMIPTGWSAEDIALKNFKLGIYPPESAVRSNPWREWIGAQMRAAICGMSAPGDARLAAELAWRDGCISHVNNGILGEIFNAVMVSLAYVETDIRTVLEKAMSIIPKDSEYFHVIDFAYKSCLAHDNYMDAWLPCEEEFKAYNWIHAYPNAAAEVVALYFAGNDFDKCLNYISMMGEDCDCNAAQIANIYGCMFGHDCIDSHWSDPIGDDLLTFVRGYEKLTITELAKRTVDAVNAAKAKK